MDGAAIVDSGRAKKKTGGPVFRGWGLEPLRGQLPRRSSGLPAAPVVVGAVGALTRVAGDTLTRFYIRLNFMSRLSHAGAQR
jgi:hypothetical protein